MSAISLGGCCLFAQGIVEMHEMYIIRNHYYYYTTIYSLLISVLCILIRPDVFLLCDLYIMVNGLSPSLSSPEWSRGRVARSSAIW